MNLLIDLFDYSGNAAEPYRANDWHVLQVDIKHGIDILTWDYQTEIRKAFYDNWDYLEPLPKIGLLAAIPCTDYALSGAAHFAKKDIDGRTEQSQKLVQKVLEIKEFIEKWYILNFWRVENPMSRIHKLNNWLGDIKLKINPCDYAGYNYSITESDLERLEFLKSQNMSKVSKADIQLVLNSNTYNKQTWLFGDFNIPIIKRIEPTWKEFPGHILYGGKSEATKEKRSVDPKGFCQAFYEFNH